ncbi:MAG TPA: hypothetical protein K8V15_10050 [Tessaracoccus flavescens]|uniref:Uncharacterized protein n=1 Tax=Tessaracoccus flavescens TaxID=399497 RepID=A0A921EPN8_9ACTN|nr:hypothetical protein [Tessaracoccus flavescens]
MTTTPTIPEVAAKRGWQTLLTGLGVDIVVALALVLTTTVVPAMESWESVVTSWPVWLLVALRSVIQAVAAWAIRRWADGSSTEVAPRSAVESDAE